MSSRAASSRLTSIAALVVCACAAPGAAAAAPAFTARVVDARTGAPIGNAEICVAGTSGAAHTDADGHVTWTIPPDTPAVLVVTLEDGRVARPVRLARLPDGPLPTIRVEPAVDETLTVTGVAGAIDAGSGTGLLRIGAEDLALRHPATLVQALEGVPGVGAIGEGQGAAPVVRGLGRGRTLILVDGVRATSERRVGPNAAFVDPGTARSVEIARGPGSVAYGSDALGGVIAVQLARPERTPGWRGAFTGTLGGGVPERHGELELSRGHGSGAVLLALRARGLRDYRAPSGPVTNSAWRDRGARVAWDQELGSARLVVRFDSALGRDLGRPRSDSDVTRVTTPVDDSHRFSLSWQRPRAGALRNLRVDALVGTANQRTDQERLPAATRARSLESSETSQRDVQVRAVAERAAGRARLQAGLDLQGRHGLRDTETQVTYDLAGVKTATTARLAIDRADRTGVGAFASAAVPLTPRLRASVGGRVDSVRSRNRGGFWGERSTSNTAAAGAAGLTAVPANALAFTLQVARGFRDPTLSERFFRGPVGRGIVEGNPDLTPETSLQVDLSARLTTGRVQAEVSAYRYRVTDLVERYAVTPTLFRYRNRGAARFEGLELLASVSLTRGLTLETSAQASRGRDAVDRTPLDDVTPASVSLALRHVLGTRANAYLRWTATRAHTAAGPSEVPTPGYQRLDLGASWRITPRLALHGTARNLTDASYYASAGPRWVFAPGRQAALSASVAF